MGAGTISGVVSGANNFTKVGAGSLNLSAINNYSGTNNVMFVTLNIVSVDSLGNTTSTTVAAGAALNFNFSNGTLSNTNSITLNGTGVSGSRSEERRVGKEG